MKPEEQIKEESTINVERDGVAKTVDKIKEKALKDMEFILSEARKNLNIG